MKRPILFFVLMLIWLPALAHKPSDSYLSILVNGRSVVGQWDIALRDLDYAIGLDTDGDGKITWGELRTRHDAIAAYALSHLRIGASHVSCTTNAIAQLVDYHSDGAYAVLRFAADCPGRPKTLELRYQLFFELDPLHRGLLRVEHAGNTHTAVFSPEEPSRRIDLAVPTPWRTFFEFGREGIWHIWIGYDHILFLLSLLLPAVLRRGAAGWQAVTGFRAAFWEVTKIVTAFTVAHSITLSFAALEVISLSVRLTESLIAASVLIAALNNVYPVVTRRLAVVAFVFGLIHGLGFANVLIDLGLRKHVLVLSLFGFNLGIELGQLAIVGVFLPLAFGLRHSWLYQRLVLQLGSVLIAVVALVWLVERSLTFTPRFFAAIL